MSRFNIWIILLLASVLLNGALIGAGARSWIAPETISPASAPAHERRAGRGFDIRAFLNALPPQYRETARARAMAERGALRAEMREAGRARRAALQALSADAFDPQAAAQALAQARAARAVIESRTEALILDIADDLSPEERRMALRAALGPARLPDRRDGRAAPQP